MRAGLFINPGSALATAAEQGLWRLGYTAVVQVPGAWEVSQAERGLDAVVVHGRRGPCGAAAAHYAAQGVPVVMFDLPHLRAAGGQMRVSPLAHDWLPAFDGLPPLVRLDRLRIEVRARRRVKGQAVLLVGQKGGDTAHGMDAGALRRWTAATLATIRAQTDGKVVWRPHPGDVWKLDGADGYSDPATETIREAFDRAWLVVTYNSTAGLEALIEGLPVVAEGRAVYSSLSWRLNQWGRIAGPPDAADVRDLLAAIAYTQWSLDEIATGLPLGLALGGGPLPGRVVEPAQPPAPPALEVEVGSNEPPVLAEAEPSLDPPPPAEPPPAPPTTSRRKAR